MASVIPNLYSLKTSTVVIGSTNYEAAISGAVFTPTTATSSFPAINGTVYNTVGATTWTLTLDYAQDLATSGSLQNHFLASNGTPEVVKFTPVAGGPTVTATILPTPGAIGAGDTNTATATGQFTVNGAPVVSASGS